MDLDPSAAAHMNQPACGRATGKGQRAALQYYVSALKNIKSAIKRKHFGFESVQEVQEFSRNDIFNKTRVQSSPKCFSDASNRAPVFQRLRAAA